MATDTGPDLSAAVEAVDALMDDTCVATWDVEGTDDDVLNTVTGELSPPVNDSVGVYDGPCKIAPWGQDQPRHRTSSGTDERPRWYRLGIPLNTPLEQVPPRGAKVIITSSRRDEWLVDKEFIVKEQLGSTMAVSRRLMVELVQ